MSGVTYLELMQIHLKMRSRIIRYINTPELRIAVEDCLEQLRILYPDYNFSAVYGG